MEVATTGTMVPAGTTATTATTTTVVLVAGTYDAQGEEERARRTADLAIAHADRMGREAARAFEHAARAWDAYSAHWRARESKDRPEGSARLALVPENGWDILPSDGRWPTPDDEAPDEEEEELELSASEWVFSLKFCADGATSLTEAAGTLRSLADEFEELAGCDFWMVWPITNGQVVVRPPRGEDGDGGVR